MKQKLTCPIRARDCYLALFWVALSFTVSCGGVGIFNGASVNASAGPSPEKTVVPPSPVTGSYLTSVLLDESSKPISDAEVNTTDEQSLGRTNHKGVFNLPVQIINDDIVLLDVEIDGQTLHIEVGIPSDIAKSARGSAEGKELERALGILLPNGQSQTHPTHSSSNRIQVSALSLPKQLPQKTQLNGPVTPLSVTSHKNGDTVASTLSLTGRCTPGTVIQVTGMISQIGNVPCVGTDIQGSFQIAVTLPEPDERKFLTVTQREPVTNEYLSQTLMLKRSSSRTSMPEWLVPRIATGGVTSPPSGSDTSGLGSITLPTVMCGTSGSVDNRISDCRAQNPTTSVHKDPSGNDKYLWQLVSLTAGGKRLWRDELTGLVWSDIVATGINWCRASGSNDKTGSPWREVDPAGYCINPTVQSQTAPESLCAEDPVHLNGTLTSHESKGGLGKLTNATTDFKWWLPTIVELATAQNHGAAAVLSSYRSYYWWSSTVLANNIARAWFIQGNNGSFNPNYDRNNADLNFAVRCVGR